MRQFHKYQLQELAKRQVVVFITSLLLGIILCNIISSWELKYYILGELLYLIPETIYKVIQINKKWKQD